METTLLSRSPQADCPQQTTDILEIFGRLGESARVSLLRFARFLESEEEEDEWARWEQVPYSEAEMEEDIAIFDKFCAEDDGYRISSEELRGKQKKLLQNPREGDRGW